MKRIFLVICLLFITGFCIAQNKKVEENLPAYEERNYQITEPERDSTIYKVIANEIPKLEKLRMAKKEIDIEAIELGAEIRAYYKVLDLFSQKWYYDLIQNSKK